MYRSAIVAFLLMFASVSTVNALQSGSSGGGSRFACPPNDEMCTCDGTYTDCTNMKLNCVDGTMQCKREGDLERCWCQRKTAVRKKPIGGDLVAPVAPAKKQ